MESIFLFGQTQKKLNFKKGENMMRKANKRLAIAILAVLLVMCFCTGTLLVQRKFADAAGVKEQEAAFVEDQVLVTLTKEETRKFLDYSAEDFREIGAKSVEDLTAATADWVEK